MRYDHRSHFDGTPDEVYAMLTDPSFREHVCEGIGSTEHHVTVDANATSATVTIDHEQEVRQIPSFAKKFVGDSIRIVQVERWRSPVAADFEVTIPGKPGSLKGQITLVQDGTGTTETIVGDLKVSVPLVGGKLESLIADQLKKAMTAERDLGQAWLASHR